MSAHPSGPEEFTCPITGEVSRQSAIVGMRDITGSAFTACHTTGSCGHRHRLDSPAGNPGWIVDGGSSDATQASPFKAPPGVWAMPDGTWYG